MKHKSKLRAAEHPDSAPALIPIAISGRHVHLTQEAVEQLFGPGHVLVVRTTLVQPGQYAAEETVTLVGPRSTLTNVRIVGPLRAEIQVEISRTDEIKLGIDAPMHESGDLAGTPGIVIEGPAGSVTIDHGVICALRHLHMSPADAVVLGQKNHDRVAVAVAVRNRRLIFGDIIVRVSPESRLELHIDADEANAACLHSGDEVMLVEIRMDAYRERRGDG